MPIKASAKKAAKRSQVLRVKNNVIKDKMKETVKVIKKAVVKGEKVVAEALSNAYKVIDKAAQNNTIHKNTAARKKSRLTKLVAKSAK